MTVRAEGAAPSEPLISTIRARSLAVPTIRLDAKYYQEEFTLARARVTGCGIPATRVAKLADAFVPSRSALVTSPKFQSRNGLNAAWGLSVRDICPSICRHVCHAVCS